MQLRRYTDITIKRPTSNGDSDVLTIPITPTSKRTFSLMQEDSIDLVFSLPTAVHFAIGDYVEDELFGKFVVLNEQMPNYNTNTGGYDYTLKMHAWYYAWKNYLHCLVSDSKRMEASWSLTERLSVQATQIIENLNVIGFTGCSIDVTAENAAEVKCLTFSGKSLIEAMQMIAEAWECEWWVSDKVIHFGKCEDSSAPLEFELGENVESMTIANNRNSFANRIYAFGGTQNIPEDYDRTLIFTADTNDNGHWSDSQRPLTQEMADANGIAYTALRISSPFSVTQNDNVTTLIASTNGWSVESDSASVEGIVKFDILNNLTAYVDYEITISASIASGGSVVIYSESGEMHTPQLDREINLNGYLTTNGYSGLVIKVEFTNNGSGTLSITRKDLSLTSVGVHKHNVSIPLTLTPIGSEDTYDVTFNVGDNMYGSFTFDDDMPSGFAIGSRYTLSPLSIDVPLGYYTFDYSVGTLSKVGAKRLHLPLDDYPNRYMQVNGLEDEQIVESAVVFDKIFPKMILKIASVSQTTKRDTVEHDDGSITYENWQQYHFTCTRENGTSFVFNTRYLLAGVTLTANFLTPTTLSQSGYLLAGMTFDVGFNNDTQEFTIVRNENYGIKLPESYLKPTVGDTLFLAGWNPKAISSLGLVADAEEELAEKAQDYLDAIEQGQFTFTCNMMSGYFFEIVDRVAYYNIGIPFYTIDDEQLYVKMPSDGYIMPIEGQRVTIKHDALDGDKTSRVIGYQFKLDKPYDKPQYTIGETQAFSRLAKLEKEVTKLT